MTAQQTAIERIACRVNRMNRDQCIDQLRRFRAFPLDFTPAYLQQMSVEKLRHVLTAAMITAQLRV
jgi:hypothetical protein